MIENGSVNLNMFAVSFVFPNMLLQLVCPSVTLSFGRGNPSLLSWDQESWAPSLTVSSVH